MNRMLARLVLAFALVFAPVAAGQTTSKIITNAVAAGQTGDMQSGARAASVTFTFCGTGYSGVLAVDSAATEAGLAQAWTTTLTTNSDCTTVFSPVPVTKWYRVRWTRTAGTLNGWMTIGTIPAGGGTPATCVSVGQVPFLGSPTTLGLVCSDAIAYSAATQTLSAPTLSARNVTATASADPVITPPLVVHGTPGTTSRGYKVVGYFADGNHTAASAEVTIATGPDTLSGTDYVSGVTAVVTGATSYRVYRTTGTGTGGAAAPRLIYTGASLSWSDTGAAGTSETPATTNTTGRLSGAWQGKHAWDTTVAAASSPEVTSEILFPLEPAAPRYGTVTQSFANAYGTRVNQVVSTGWNVDSAKAGEPIWITSHESDFCPNASACLSEWHLAWTNGGVGYRFLSFSGNRIDNSATGYIQTGILGFRGLDNLIYESLDTTSTSKLHFLYHGTKFVVDTNNVSPFSQINAAGDAYIDLFRLNASNELELGNGQPIAFTGALRGSSSTASNNGVALGTGSTASGTASTATGNSAYSRLYGQVTNAYNAWSTAGQSQWSRVPMSVQLSTAADAEMLIGRIYRVTMQTGVAYSCRINVIVTDYADRTKVVAFEGKFAATMSGAVGTALLNGVATEIALTEVYGNVATLTAFAKADTTNGAIGIWIRPPAANTNTYIGTASLEWVEISYN